VGGLREKTEHSSCSRFPKLTVSPAAEIGDTSNMTDITKPMIQATGRPYCLRPLGGCLQNASAALCGSCLLAPRSSLQGPRCPSAPEDVKLTRAEFHLSDWFP
jgi:hypothetical protein